MQFLILKILKNAIILIFSIISLITSNSSEAQMKDNFSNKISDDKMLLVLSAPSIHDTYYKLAFLQLKRLKDLISSLFFIKFHASCFIVL